MTIAIGNVAPAFILPGLEGIGTPAQVARDFSLAEYPGSARGDDLLPGRQHHGVHRAAERLHRRHRPLRRRRCGAPGHQPPVRDSHAEFCEQGGFAFPLLADADQEVGEAYGILGPLGFYRRSAFVVHP